jgi:hypothetical protein
MSSYPTGREPQLTFQHPQSCELPPCEHCCCSHGAPLAKQLLRGAGHVFVLQLQRQRSVQKLCLRNICAVCAYPVGEELVIIFDCHWH